MGAVTEFPGTAEHRRARLWRVLNAPPPVIDSHGFGDPYEERGPGVWFVEIIDPPPGVPLVVAVWATCERWAEVAADARWLSGHRGCRARALGLVRAPERCDPKYFLRPLPPRAKR